MGVRSKGLKGERAQQRRVCYWLQEFLAEEDETCAGTRSLRAHVFGKVKLMHRQLVAQYVECVSLG